MGEQYDNEIKDLRKVDFEYEQLLAKCKVRALKENKMDVYDGLDQKKMNRAAMKIYLQGGKKKDTDSFDLTEVNKVWEGQDLHNPAYGDFWKGDDPARKKPSRGSQSVKRSRGGSRGSQGGGDMLTTPERKRRQIRELYLPEINKNTWVKKKEVDLSTLYEDPFFDLVKSKANARRGMRGGRGSVDNRNVQFGKIPGEIPEEEDKTPPATGAPSATTAPTAAP